MNPTEKPIVFSAHAADRMRQRGATAAEVEGAVRNGAWKPAQRGKFQVKGRFPFNSVSPVNGQRYAFKAVEVVFANEQHAIVVVTVKVFYHN